MKRKEMFKMKKVISVLLALVIVLSVFTACSGTGNTGDSTTTKGETEVTADGYKQAPILDDMELPAVEERLPVEKDVFVEEVVDQIGQYGGDLYYPWLGIDEKWTIEMFTEEALFRFQNMSSEIEPNVAKGYDVNEDATEYTIYFREGMKWSDGVDFTADDVIFYWEKMMKPEIFGKAVYNCYYSVDQETGEKTICEVEKVDNYTVKVTFKHPSPIFLKRLAIDNKWFFAPMHFYEKILPEFVGEEEALKVAKENGYTDIDSFLSNYGAYYYWIYPGRPTLRAWTIKNAPTDSQVIYTRNPYFWKVDEMGQQLPYIDNLIWTQVQDESQKLLYGISGDADIHVYQIENFITLKENEEKGGYTVRNYGTPRMSSTNLSLNHSAKDEKYREIFQDIRFREALSVAANREEISEICTDGLAKPAQAAIIESMPDYQEGWREKWVEFEPERAKTLLDEIGMKYDGEFRAFPDGSEFTLLLYSRADRAIDVTLHQLLKKYYEAIGIRVDLKSLERSYYEELAMSNDIMATSETDSVFDISLRPDNAVPVRNNAYWCVGYGIYAESPDNPNAVKPENDMAEMMGYWGKLQASKTPEEIRKWAREISGLHKENIYIIGFTEGTPEPVLVSNRLKNVPMEGITTDELRSLGNSRPVQFYLDED